MEPRGCSAQHLITHGKGDPPAPVSTKATGWKFHSGRHRWVNCMVCGSKDGAIRWEWGPKELRISQPHEASPGRIWAKKKRTDCSLHTMYRYLIINERTLSCWGWLFISTYINKLSKSHRCIISWICIHLFLPCYFSIFFQRFMPFFWVTLGTSRHLLCTKAWVADARGHGDSSTVGGGVLG